MVGQERPAYVWTASELLSGLIPTSNEPERAQDKQAQKAFGLVAGPRLSETIAVLDISTPRPHMYW